MIESSETYLCTRDRQEADTHEDAADGDLTVTKLDTIKVEDTQTVCADQAVQRKNLVHLDGGDKCASSLSDDVRNGNDIGKLAGERSSNGSVTELQ